MPFVPDKPSRGRFVPDAQTTEKKEPTFGEAVKKAYEIANMPASKSREGLKMLTDLIPDPQTQSVAWNIALGTPKTLAEIGSELAASSIAPESLATMGAAKAIPKGGAAKAIQATKGFARKAIPKVQEALTGVKAKTFQRVFDEPGVIRRKFMGGPKGLKEAGEAIETAETKAFGNIRPTAREVNDPMLSQARKTAIRTMEFIDKVEQAGPEAAGKVFSNPEFGKEILKARRATDVMLESPSAKGSQRFFLEEQKKKLNGLLEQYYPEVREANLQYSRSKTRADVTKLLPVLKSGNPSVARLFMTTMARGAGVPIGFSSPILNAVGTSLTRLSFDALEKLATVPHMRELVLAEIARRRSNANSASR